MANSSLVVNGLATSASDVSVSFGTISVPLQTMKSISYKRTVDSQAAYGLSNEPYDTTEGQAKYENFKFKVAESDWEVLMVELFAQGLPLFLAANPTGFIGVNLLEVVTSRFNVFPISVQYQLIGGIVVLNDILYSARILSYAPSVEGGSDVQYVDVEGSFLRLYSITL